MTYMIVLEHCLFPLSCKIISICMLVVYRFISALLYFPYLFVREYAEVILPFIQRLLI